MHIRRISWFLLFAVVSTAFPVVALSPRALAQTAAAAAAAAAAKKRAAAGSATTASKPPPGKAKATPGTASRPPTTGSTGAQSDVVRAREAQIAELISEPPSPPAAPTTTAGPTAAGSNGSKAGDPNAPIVVVASKSELTPLDGLDLETLELFSRWLTTDTSAASKEVDLDAFMTRSRIFLKRRPDELRPWLLRARLALRNSRVAEGMEAAENLKRLGAVASSDEKTHRMMLALNLKGWLQSDAPLNPELGRTLATAELGDPKAQSHLSQMFGTGNGVAKNPAEALRWCIKAADGGDAEGQLSLATMYRDGRGVPKDDAQAVLWYRKSARQGNVAAQEVLRKRDLSW